MVQEVRRIMFEEEELIAAFDLYRKLVPGFLPRGQIAHCKPGEASVHVGIKPEPTGSIMEYTYKDTEAVKPLIQFCINNHIMMPRAGQKSLHVRDGMISLYIVYTQNLLQIPTAARPQESPPLDQNSILPGDIANANANAETKA